MPLLRGSTHRCGNRFDNTAGCRPRANVPPRFCLLFLLRQQGSVLLQGRVSSHCRELLRSCFTLIFTSIFVVFPVLLTSRLVLDHFPPSFPLCAMTFHVLTCRTFFGLSPFLRCRIFLGSSSVLMLPLCWFLVCLITHVLTYFSRRGVNFLQLVHCAIYIYSVPVCSDCSVRPRLSCVDEPRVRPTPAGCEMSESIYTRAFGASTADGSSH